jgi:hypothetical protein
MCPDEAFVSNDDSTVAFPQGRRVLEVGIGECNKPGPTGSRQLALELRGNAQPRQRGAPCLPGGAMSRLASGEVQE